MIIIIINTKKLIIIIIINKYNHDTLVVDFHPSPRTVPACSSVVTKTTTTRLTCVCVCVFVFVCFAEADLHKKANCRTISVPFVVLDYLPKRLVVAAF